MQSRQSCTECLRVYKSFLLSSRWFGRTEPTLLSQATQGPTRKVRRPSPSRAADQKRRSSTPVWLILLSVAVVTGLVIYFAVPRASDSDRSGLKSNRDLAASPSGGKDGPAGTSGGFGSSNSTASPSPGKADGAVLTVSGYIVKRERIELNEADVAKAFLGQKCRVNPEAYPDKAYEGYVVEMAPEANRQKGTLQLKVQIKNPDRFLTPELSARVDFLTGDKASAQAPGK